MICENCGSPLTGVAAEPGRRRRYCSRACHFKDRTRPIAERFWCKVDKSGSCWNWTASLNSKGYGQLMMTGGRPSLAHRIAWELTNGPIDGGVHVLHRCDNPLCVNPDHLFLGNQRDNMTDMVSKDRHARGQRRKNAKLTESKVREIRQLHANGQRMVDLVARFGVCHSLISNVIHGKAWKHV